MECVEFYNYGQLMESVSLSHDYWDAFQIK